MLRFPLRRLLLSLPCLALSLTAAEPLPYGQWVDHTFQADTGAAAALLTVGTNDGFVLHDRSSLEPRFVARDGAEAFMFLPGGDRLIVKRDGFRSLDLTNGKIEPLFPPLPVAALFHRPDNATWLALLGEPTAWEATRLVATRLDPSGRTPPQPLGSVAPLAFKRLELRRILPSRTADHAVLVLRDVEDTGDPYEPRRYGDFQFVHLNLDTGATAPLATLAASPDFDLNESLHWTGPDRALLNTATYPDYAYTLIDPYAGRVVRTLKVPGVQFNTGEPGLVTAFRRVQENGVEKLYRDYLEPGTLKTLRNVPLADESDQPDRPKVDLPEGATWLTAPGAPVSIVKIQPQWDAPYALRRIDASGRTLATYDGTAGGLHRYGGFAFHPSEPEFFASTGDGDVHFFRFTNSGLKRQIRGSAATSPRYTPDGQALLSTEYHEGPVSVTPAATFPLEPAFAYEYPPLRDTMPEYDQGLTLSPANTWLIVQSSTFSSLHRFGEPALVAQLPLSERDLPDAYAFSADETRLARLARHAADEEGYAPPAHLSVLSVAALASAGYDEQAWSLELPHGDFRLAGWTPAGELVLVDLAAAELAFATPGQETLRTAALPGLSPQDFDPVNARVDFDPKAQRLALRLRSAAALVTLGDAAPPPVRLPLEANVARFHRLESQDRLVLELDNGSLAFVELAQGAPTLTATLEFYNEGRDYLLRTPAGQFDASPAIQADGSLLRGYSPVRLSQISGQAYTPDLFSRLFAGLPPDTDVLPDVVIPPTVELAARTSPASALRVLLNLRAESRIENIAELRVYQNGKLAATVPPSHARGASKDLELDLLLVPENTFRLVAVTEGGLESLPAEAVVRPPEAELRRAAAAERPPELHLLVVGVNQYRNPEYNLNFAEADAAGILEKLEAANRPLFGKINSTRLVSAEATHDGILAAFAKVRAAARPQDAFVFYFAGHGVMAKAENAFYLVPHDVTRIYGASQSLSENGLPASRLRELSAGIAAQKQLFILDACNSGGALQAFAERGASQEKALAQLARATGTHWITASSADQLATEFADLGHGAFTHTLLQALGGAADTGDKRITVNELKAYLETELPAVSKRHKGSPQYPSSYGYGQDFPIALIP